MLGVAYQYGHDVPQDYSESVKWYRKSEEQGYTGAQNNLGAMYLEGDGVPQVYAEALKLFRKAVEQGDSGAQYNLAGMYAKGNGVPQDYVEAMKLYRNLAAQGDPPSQFKLGVAYADGNGVPKNYVEAYMWLNMAIAHDYESAIEKRDEIKKLMTSEQIENVKMRLSGWAEIQSKACERIRSFCNLP